MKSTLSSSWNLVLASASPRRQDLLRNLSVDFSVQVADIDEMVWPNESSWEYVARVAQSKAEHVQRLEPNAAILSADTIVTYANEIFGKPRHQEHALEMWRQLSGSQHQVVTSVCLMCGDKSELITVSTDVVFVELNENQMLKYWQSGEPQDKAGGYAIQGLASAWVQEVHGSYSNVVGLPLFETNQLLQLVGHNWL